MFSCDRTQHAAIVSLHRTPAGGTGANFEEGDTRLLTAVRGQEYRLSSSLSVKRGSSCQLASSKIPHKRGPMSNLIQKLRLLSHRVQRPRRKIQSLQPQWQLARLEPRQMLAGDAGMEVGLALDLRGETGQERVEVYFGDNNLGPRFLSTDWQRFEFDVDSSSYRPEDIQVRFLNDLYQPENGLDRNVYVGTMVLNGEEFDPNDANVFSTGTWRPEDGVVAGTGRGSVINANGYLQFGEPQGSRLTVYARGDTGSELFTVRAGREDFQSTAVTTDLQAYEFFLNEDITPNSVRIEYFNDRFIPSAGVDRNLFVDRIELDGVTIETESPDVFVTGAFFDGARQEGFLQTETLFTNGFIQYGARTQDGPRYTQAAGVSGGDGLIELGELGDEDFVTATSLSDGSLVGVAQRFNDFETQSVLIEVFDSSGNLDRRFNNGVGRDLSPIIEQTIPAGASQISYRVDDLLADSQDRIIAAVSGNFITGDGQRQSFQSFIRIMRSGDVDASFGTAGFASLPTQERFSTTRFALDVLDRLLVADGDRLIRLNNLGQLDQGFGQGGVANYQSTADDQSVEEVTTRADRSIVLLKSKDASTNINRTEDVSFVYQFNENGTAGTWFGNDGVASIPVQRQTRGSVFQEVYRDVELDSEERIILRGTRTVIRLTPNGQFDSSFGNHGVTLLPVDVVSDGQFFRFGIASGAVVDSNDRILLAAEEGFIRLDVFGRLDTSFSEDGYGGVSEPDGLLAFDVSDLQLDSLGRLFSPVRSTTTPSIAVWELV